MDILHKLHYLTRNAKVSAAGYVCVSSIPFRPEFREACAANQCGKYGACWMCPPAVGDIDKMIAQARRFKDAFVFQTIGVLEDSFDIEGMEQAAKSHNTVTREIASKARSLLPNALVLGAGNCGICAQCTQPFGEPCRHPQEAIPSMEAYGIAVSELAALAGLRYINGANTITYFGAVLYNE